METKARKLASNLKELVLSLVTGMIIGAVLVLLSTNISIFEKNPNLANAYVALGTSMLAVAAFWSIWQNHLLQKRKRRERLLNEIIEWAMDVAKCSLEKGIFDESIPVSGLQAEQALRQLLDSVVGFRIARASSVYTSSIASEIYPELKNSVDNLTEEIKAQIKLIMEYKRKLTPTWPAGQIVAKIAGNNERTYNLATTLIEEATKIKTKDIGKKEENMSKESEATTSKEPTPKDIEEHLKNQDYEMIKGRKIAMASVGGAVVLVGITLLAEKYIAFPLDIIAIAFLIIAGFGFMFLELYEFLKYRQEYRQHKV